MQVKQAESMTKTLGIIRMWENPPQGIEYSLTIDLNSIYSIVRTVFVEVPQTRIPPSGFALTLNPSPKSVGEIQLETPKAVLTAQRSAQLLGFRLFRRPLTCRKLHD